MRLDDRAVALGKLCHDGAGEVAVGGEDGAHVLTGDQDDPAFFKRAGRHQIGRILHRRGKDEGRDGPDRGHAGFPPVPGGKEIDRSGKDDMEEIARVAFGYQFDMRGEVLDIGAPHQCGEIRIGHRCERIEIPDL